MPRLAAGEQLAEIDILLELDPDHIVANPHDRGGNALRGQLEIDLLADCGRPADDRQNARRLKDS